MYVPGWWNMDKTIGTFGTSLTSLQLQLATLMEDVGGNAACNLLDAMSALSATERRAMLGTFTKVVEKFTQYGVRVASKSDIEKEEFEEALFKDILSAMREAAEEPTQVCKSLTVLKGGKVRSLKRRGLNRELRVVDSVSEGSRSSRTRPSVN